MIALITHHTAVRLAEIGALLIVIAGIWYVVADLFPTNRFAATRRVGGGIALAAAGVLLIIAIHWGHFS